MTCFQSRSSLFCTRREEMKSLTSHLHMFVRTVARFSFRHELRSLFGCVDAPSMCWCFCSCPMKCCDRDRLFSASVQWLSRNFFGSKEKGYTPANAIPSHSSGQRTFAALDIEFRTKIHNATTQHNSFCLDHTLHYTEVTAMT